MTYTKIISYANTVEINEYEYEILQNHGRRPTGREDITNGADSDTGGTDPLQTRDDKAQMGRRSDNARRASLAFRRLVACNLGRSARPVLVTLTYADNYTDLSGAYKHYSAFVQSLRRQFGSEFKYICVPEFQKRGAVHFHALFWGIPEEVLLLERKDRTLARLWAKGFVYLKETDGGEKLSFYLAKYMSKAFIDPRLKNQKSYVASRNVKRPRVEAGNFKADTVIPYLGLEDEPVIDKTYQTTWLGEGRYRLYKLKDDQS